MTDANSFVRAEIFLGSTLEHSETLTNNTTNGTARNGFQFRAKGTAPASDGSIAQIVETTALPMRGMGLTPVVIPEFKFMTLSVGLP